MPVYNAGSFLVEAIESILSQTYKNFEFIIVDDCSTDNSWSILRNYAKKDSRIRLFRNTKNLGVSETAQKAIAKARGEFLARMDADDIASPSRLETQLNYLLAHPETVAVGGQCLVIDKDGQVIGEKKFPLSFEEIYSYIFKFIPVQQPTLMIAKGRLPKDFKFYRDGMNTAEEVELFFKLFQYGKVENLPEFVLKYRLHNNNTSLKNLKKTYLLTFYSRIGAVFQYGYRPSWDGLITTLLEAILVLLLPKQWTLALYKKVRNLQENKVLSLQTLPAFEFAT